MAFAITKVQCFGIEAEECVNKRYKQYMVLDVTAANTDTDWDLGEYVSGSLGTFWDAVDGTTIGANSLQAIRDIVSRAAFFDGIGGTAAGVGTSLLMFESAASAGGAASEALTCTGVLTTDQLVGAFMFEDGANAGALTETTITASDQITCNFTTNPGAGAVIRVLVRRGAEITAKNGAVNLSYKSGSAPTSAQVVLKWILDPAHPPVEYYATA